MNDYKSGKDRLTYFKLGENHPGAEHNMCTHVFNVVRSNRLEIDILQIFDYYSKEQDAQLSQRDRAAGCAIVFAKVEDWNWETIFHGHYRSIFNHCDIIGLKICRIRFEKSKNKS